MADVVIVVKGLKELNEFLDTFPEKMQNRAMRGGLRAGMNVVKPIAQANIHSVSGALAKGLKVSTRSRGGTVTASLKATGPHGYVAKFLEYGTAPHMIAAKFGKALQLADGKLVRAVHHPGTWPRPFMRPALDSEAKRAVDATAAYIKMRLDTEDWRGGSSMYQPESESAFDAGYVPVVRDTSAGWSMFINAISLPLQLLPTPGSGPFWFRALYTASRIVSGG